jgi:hypothetical protein
MAAELRRTSDARRQRRGDEQVRPGAFNVAGELFDPSGARLTLMASEITPAQAAHAVRDGAILAFESCGCGGGVGGCEIEWFDFADRAHGIPGGEPTFVNEYGSPTWIDVWSGVRRVVFAHGDVTWGSILL